MKRIILPVLMLLISGGTTSAQMNRLGVPMMKSYGLQVTHGSEYNYSIVRDKSGVVYFGSDNKGIIRYDGHTWLRIPVNKEPVIRTLGVSEQGVVYVGGSFEFGYLEPSGNGTVKYVSISDRYEHDPDDTSASEKKTSIIGNEQVHIGEILSLLVTDTIVYFGSQESLFIYHPEKDSVEHISLKKHDILNMVRLANINGRIILSDNRMGLFEFKNREIVRLPGGEFFRMKRSLVLMPSGANGLFVGTYEHGAFTLDLKTGAVNDSPLDRGLNQKLIDAQLYCAIDLHSGERLLGTILDGIYVLDKNLKLIGKWDTKTTDLPNNTITALYLGSEPVSELWISSAAFVTTAYVGLPATVITPRMGYEGLLNNLIDFDGTIYLAGDNGLFRSYADEDGLLSFRLVDNINDQVWVLTQGRAGNETFLIAGSNKGIYKISRDGSVSKVDRQIKYPDTKSESDPPVRTCIQSKVFPNRFYFGLNTKGVLSLEYDGSRWHYVSKFSKNIKGYVNALIEDADGNLFICTGTPTGLYHLPVNDSIPEEFTAADGIPQDKISLISRVGNDIVVTTGDGLYRFVQDTHKWTPYNELLGGYTKGLFAKDLIEDSDGDLWLTTLEDRIYEVIFRKDSVAITPYKGQLNLLPNLEKTDFREIEGRFWMAKSENVYVIDKQKFFSREPARRTLLSRIVIGTDSLLMNNTFFKTLPEGKRIPWHENTADEIPEIKFNFNSVSFSWTMPFYIDEESTLFQYRLDGFDKTWSKWEKTYYKDFTNLPFGKYTFRVRARTATDIVSAEAVYEFYILKPWYFTIWMIIIYAIAVSLIIAGIIKAYTRKLKNENIRLEGIVAERTAVVVKQKEELESSIHYARRIQMALLPSESILSENLKNYFILFKPRDIVSGDFYWMTKKDNRLYIVAADCTGHGVPGAFMSLLGMSFLDEIIDKEKAPRADHVLSELRLHVTESLKQSGGDDEAKDGMDLALLVIDFNVSRVEFSGAYNPCFRVRKLTDDEARNYTNNNMEMADGSMSNGKYLLETIYASKMPIGISSRMDEKFALFDWQLEKGVSYYLFSDGYIDQFGGSSGRKFMKKNFKRFILDIQDYPMKRQKELLDQNLHDWMGQSPQIDDILVMGIRTD